MDQDLSTETRSRLPTSVCLRVTRACNARCGFCLAPPRGHGVAYESIQRRLRWLASAGVRKVNLSGGEPTIRRDLPDIIAEAHDCGLVSAMTSNGILLPTALLERLRLADTRVKVSIHGAQPLHDAMLGRSCYEQVDGNVRRLLDAGVSTAIQTVVTGRQPDVHERMIDYCLERGVRKLRLIPFVPRGRGLQLADSYQLGVAQREQLETAVGTARHVLEGSLDVRVLDFWVNEYYVLETDGALQIQRERDAADSTVAYVA